MAMTAVGKNQQHIVVQRVRPVDEKYRPAAFQFGFMVVSSVSCFWYEVRLSWPKNAMGSKIIAIGPNSQH